MAKKTDSKKTVTKKSPTKKPTTAGATKKAGTKSSAPKAKSSTASNKPSAKSAASTTAAAKSAAPQPSAAPPKAAPTPKTGKNPVKMKNVLLSGPARLGSSLGMSSTSTGGLNLSKPSNANKKKKSQDPVAAAVTKQFGPTGASKMQGNTAGVGARSQMRRDTKKG